MFRRTSTSRTWNSRRSPTSFFPAYFRGRNLAESYYLAIPGSELAEHRGGRSPLQIAVMEPN